jgi:hypothetical protein
MAMLARVVSSEVLTINGLCADRPTLVLLVGETRTDNSKSEIQGFFAPLRMTT